MSDKPTKNRTSVGTDIDEVKKKNAQSGMSYNEAKAFIARETGGFNTGMYSDTHPKEVRKEIEKETQQP